MEMDRPIGGAFLATLQLWTKKYLIKSSRVARVAGVLKKGCYSGVILIKNNNLNTGERTYIKGV